MYKYQEGETNNRLCFTVIPVSFSDWSAFLRAKAGYSFDGRQVGIKILVTDKLAEIMRAVEAVK